MSTGHQENWEAVCAAAGLMPTAPPELVVQAIRSRALEDLAQELTAAVEVKQSSEDPNPLSWQTGALWGRDRARVAAASLPGWPAPTRDPRTGATSGTLQMFNRTVRALHGQTESGA